MPDILTSRRMSQLAGGIENLLLAVFVLGFGFLPVYSALHPQFVGPAEVGVSLFLLPVALIAGFILAWRLFGQEKIAIADDTLLVIRSVGPFTRTVSVPLAEISRVSVLCAGRRAIQSRVFGVGYPAVQVEGSSSRVRCGLALGPAEGADLARQIETAVETRRRRTRA
jgi:hypothetical protein